MTRGKGTREGLQLEGCHHAPRGAWCVLFLAGVLLVGTGAGEQPSAPGETPCTAHSDCSSASGNAFCKLERCKHPGGLEHLCGRCDPHPGVRGQGLHLRQFSAWQRTRGLAGTQPEMPMRAELTTHVAHSAILASKCSSRGKARRKTNSLSRKARRKTHSLSRAATLGRIARGHHMDRVIYCQPSKWEV